MDGIVEKIRSFNRMYAQKIGIFSEKIFDVPFSLAEIRILHELSLRDVTTASALSKTLDIDGGYLSRILTGFEKNGLIVKKRSVEDARAFHISLTAQGRETWVQASHRASENVKKMIEPLSPEQRAQLISAMAVISTLLGDPAV